MNVKPVKPAYYLSSMGGAGLHYLLRLVFIETDTMEPTFPKTTCAHTRANLQCNPFRPYTCYLNFIHTALTNFIFQFFLIIKNKYSCFLKNKYSFETKNDSLQPKAEKYGIILT